MSSWYKVLLFFTLIMLLCPQESWARRGGGSIGGRGGFSAGRSTGGGFSRSPVSSGGYRGGYRSYGTGGPGFFVCLGGPSYVPSSSTTSDDSSAIAIAVTVLVILGIIIAFRTIRARKEIEQGWTDQLEGDGMGIVTRLSVAFYATESHLQHDLEALAKTSRVGTPEGDALVVREACVIMNRSRDAMTRYHFEQHVGLSRTAARAKLDEIGNDLRARYEEETIRSDEGGLREKAQTVEDEVAEFIVVSIVVAYLPPAISSGPINHVPDLVERIKQIGAIGPDRLLGMEVIWDPVSPDESLSSAGMDASYPELLPL